MAMILWEQYAALSNQPEIAQNYMVYNIIYNSIIMQSVFEEFQLRAFGLDEINADTLGLLYAELFIEYGFETDFTGIPLSKDTPYHDWLRISHFFYMPFYTVSYVTSSVALMQLWEVAERDIDSAVEIYLRMIRGDQSMFFSELLESVSLRSPKEPGALRSIAAQAERFLR
jgi:oligoendopeptidase F